MGHEWIIDVLTDLKCFAKKNDLPILAIQLEDTALVALAEIESLSDVAPKLARGDSAGNRQVHTNVGASRRA